ncbi:unnamed protein product [Gulo gulo]|uniref:60S ribosomal protein L32 n=1 Tax=Gulo gulo TaxID=48420 RepID=A0A9X9LFU0_GULGU|nr:unnamed protein product [Gulo gulo]
MPQSGYGSDKKAKHMRPNGFWKSLVHHVKELEVPLVCDKSHCAEIAHSVSSKNHKAIVERVAQLAIRITSPNASSTVKKMNKQTTSVHVTFVLIKSLNSSKKPIF